MEILDCTLRDGGYYTNWDFDSELVDTYINSLNHLPVDYLEIGYRANPQEGYSGEYFYCPVYVMDNIKSSTNKKLAIILDEKNVRAEHTDKLLTPCLEYIDMVRIAVKPSNFEGALKLGEAVKKMGFTVSFNVMYMSEWESDKKLLDLFPKVDGIVDYLYLVDSYGGVYPRDVERTIQIVRDKTNVKLGFHGHNNLQMALANTLNAIENGIDIVDSTITGMGRGAGNLQTELLLTVLNSRNKLDFDFNWLSRVTEPFQQMQHEYGWKTSLPYMFSGANSIPQSQVMEWVNNRSYSYNSVIRALANQSRGMKDNQKLKKINFSNEKEYRSALIVGGGPSVVNHSKALYQLLRKNPDAVIIYASSKNAMSLQGTDNDQYFCLVGNEGYRLENVFNSVKKVEGKCVLPPFPRKMGTYIPSLLEDKAYELDNVDFTDRFQDSHTALALQTALGLDVENIYLAGYDGYPESAMSQKEQQLFKENDILFNDAESSFGKPIISLTPTKYENLKQSTIYSYL